MQLRVICKSLNKDSHILQENNEMCLELLKVLLSLVYLNTPSAVIDSEEEH